ncbi:4916_t:CDS:2, partial [Dentiscutata heterogama]
NNKSVINEAMVKDNISRAGTTNVHPSQELHESIETVIKSFTKQQNTINAISSIVSQVSDKKNSDFSPPITGDSETRDSAKYYKRDSKPARKKPIFNDTASESSSTSESGSSSESSNDDEDFTVKV